MTDAATLAITDADTVRQLKRLRKVLIGAVVIYFAAQVVIRVSISSSLVLDEAEQVLVSQKLRWGNGAQPPLYTWLQTGIFCIVGTNLFALALFKNLLLLGGFLLTYACVRRIARSELAGLEAMLSVMLMPHISWEAQRDLSHSVLLFFTTLLTLWVFIQLLETRKTIWYIVLGICVGLGVLSKYNYGLFFVTFVIAALTLRDFRRIVLDWRFLLTIACCALVVWPHVQWMLHHSAETLSHRGDFEGARDSVLEGLKQLIIGVVSYVAVIVVVYSLFFHRVLFSRSTSSQVLPYLALLGRTILLGLTLAGIGIVAFHVTQIEGRWLLPLMVLVPVWLATRVRDHLSPHAIRGMSWVASGMAVIIIAGIVIRVIIPSLGGKRQPLNMPWEAAASQIRAAGFNRGTIIASEKLIGGNLALQYKGSRTISVGLTALDVPADGDCLVVWNPLGRKEYNAATWQFAEAALGPQDHWPATQYIEAPLKNGAEGTMRLAFVQFHRPPVAPPTQPR
jgi:4-amino-4-deoxy-L-arabinose transferase-like glycosyltransferase